MSIIESSKDRPQLLIDRFRYRQANGKQETWRCVRNNSAGPVISNDMQYITLTDPNHAANPYELISIEFESKIIKRTLYDEIEEQLRDLIANFHIHPREEYFKRVRTLPTF